MTSIRYFTQAELDELALPPSEQIHRALADADPSQVGVVYERLERRFRGTLTSCRIWERGTVEAIAANDVARLRLPVLVDEVGWAVAVVNEIRVEDLAVRDLRHRAELERITAEDGAELAFDHYLTLEASYRRLRDAHRDTIAALWTVLYEDAGRRALEQCWRKLAEATLMRWMARDVTMAPGDRLREWSAVLLANFARLRIEESDDRFTLIQDPCGTCSRQLTDGRYDSSMGLATIAPFHRASAGDDHVPIYRAHVGLMHWLMPMERIGVQWPTIECPRGMGTGPCRIDLMKEPVPEV